MTTIPNTEHLAVARIFPYQSLEASLLSLLDPQELERPASVPRVPAQSLRWRSGEPLSEPARRRFVLALLEEDEAHRNVLLRWVRPFLKDLDCYKLCRRLLDFAADGVEDDEQWPLYIQSVIGSPFQMGQLAKRLKGVATQDRDLEDSEVFKIIDILKRERSMESLDCLHHWSQNSPKKSVALACRRALEEVAMKQATSVDELLGADLPELYFGVDGVRHFDYGARTIAATLCPDLNLTFSDDGGRTYRSVPSVRRSDDRERATSARREMKQLKTLIKRCAQVQSGLLESSMVHGRRWPVPLWRQRFLIHPVMRSLSRRLVFAVAQPGGRTLRPFVISEGRFTDANGELVELPVDGWVQVLHPVELPPESRQSWADLVGLAGEAPFAQLNRPTFDFDVHRGVWHKPAEMLGQARLSHVRKIKRSLGYSGTLRGVGRVSLHRTCGPYLIAIELNVEGADGQATGAVTFVEVRAVRRVWQTSSGVDAPTPPELLPRSLFSEIIWDLHRLAA